MKIINKKKIAVLMTVYKESPSYLSMSLLSVLNQTFLPSQIVIIDDSGHGVYEEFCNSYTSIFDLYGIDFLYCKNDQNYGLVHSLNYGLNLIQHDVVARMDSDDISTPDRFYKQINLINQGYDFVGSSINLFSENSFSRTVIYPSSQLGIIFSLIRNNPFAHPSVMFKASAVKNLGGYRNLDYCEDLDLWMRAFLSGFRLTNSREILLFRRIHSNQLSELFSKRQFETTSLLRKQFRRDFFHKFF